MPVSVHRCQETMYHSLRSFGEPLTYPRLSEMFTDLQIPPEDFVKIGNRGEYPYVSGMDDNPEHTAVFEVRSAYLACVFSGRDEKWASHCWLFDGGDRPFTPESIINPPQAREKLEHELTMREWLWWKWGREKRPLAKPKVYV